MEKFVIGKNKKTKAFKVVTVKKIVINLSCMCVRGHECSENNQGSVAIGTLCWYL